ncbi:STE20-like serine/threonine-protein kinase [Anolis sagrei]|uniref:STE20-like serine/threonine-protein kinase n=1 Tax=Anolis sagrei TaxID=38937 RepID=UPI0035214736
MQTPALIPTPARRLSTQYDVNPKETTFKDLLQEMLKMQEKIEKKIEESQEKTQQNMERLFQKEMGKLRHELKEDVAQIKKEVSNVQDELKILKKENSSLKKVQDKTEAKLKKLEEAKEKLEKQQELWASKETDYQLRFRNIEEKEGENLREIIMEITTRMTNITPEEMNKEIDMTQRINSSYAKRNNVPRDILVSFCRKNVRDEINRMKAKDQPSYNGKKVIILKEFTSTSMNKRKNYYFLTDVLKKHKIKFRWERLEGIQVTYRESKFWLTSEEKARDFYRRLQKDLNLTSDTADVTELSKANHDSTRTKHKDEEGKKRDKKRPRPEPLDEEEGKKDMGPSNTGKQPPDDK